MVEVERIMVLVNTTSVFGAMFLEITTSVTGSESMTFFLMAFIIMAALIGFGLPTELSVVFILPFLAFAYIAAVGSGNLGLIAQVTGVALLYVVILFVKRIFLNN
jgi:hypothetical protein